VLLFSLGSFSKITEVAQMILFSAVKNVFYFNIRARSTKMGLDTCWAILKNHLVTLA
jgi:hypothetical protein